MRQRNYFVLVPAVIACGLALLTHARSSTTTVSATEARDEAASAAAFESMTKVLHNPRCMNCHSKGDFPRQGDDEHQHTMNVRRGPNGDGIAGVKCSTCHQDHNLAGEHTPPGAPGWHLPSPEMPMIWEGLSDKQLCELFKDPAQNGHRKTQFLSEVNEWAAQGAACPR